MARAAKAWVVRLDEPATARALFAPREEHDPVADHVDAAAVCRVRCVAVDLAAYFRSRGYPHARVVRKGGA